MPMPLLLPTRLFFGVRRPKIRILGGSFSGVVEAAGSGVSRFKAGDELIGYRGAKMGANAEYLCMPEGGTVAPKPAALSHAEAAALPYGGIMARSLLERVDIRPGQKVLINGASGSIGSAAVQLAKMRGAEVTGVCSSPRLEYVRSLGADAVIDYTREDFTRSGERYDLIFDVLGRSGFARCRRVLSPRGRYLLASFKTKHLLVMLATAFGRGRKVICAMAQERQEDLRRLAELAEQGSLRPIVDRLFPLEQAAEAHRYIESGARRGSVVLVVEQG
jgi:NADPH:quinone reductase-like Zn-dependent oxidoreductase